MERSKVDGDKYDLIFFYESKNEVINKYMLMNIKLKNFNNDRLVLHWIRNVILTSLII